MSKKYGENKPLSQKQKDIIHYLNNCIGNCLITSGFKMKRTLGYLEKRRLINISKLLPFEKLKYIYFRKETKTWRVSVYISGKRMHVGNFLTREEAIKAKEEVLDKYDVFQYSKQKQKSYWIATLRE